MISTFRIAVSLAALLAVAGCSRSDVVRVAENVRVGAERVGNQYEQARAIDRINEGAVDVGGGSGAAGEQPPPAEAEAAAGAPAEAPPRPLWLQPGSPYAPQASSGPSPGASQ